MNSHLNLDHFLDVLAPRYAWALNPGAPDRALPLWMPPGGIAVLTRLATAFSERFRRAGSHLDIGELKYQFQPMVHYASGVELHELPELPELPERLGTQAELG